MFSKIFRYLLSISTGRLAYWNKITSSSINDIWYRTERLDPNYTIIFQEIIVGTVHIHNHLYSPITSKKEKVLDINIKNVSEEDFHKINLILLESLTGIFSKVNKSSITIQNKLFEGLETITEGQKSNTYILKKIESENKINIIAISNEVLKSIKKQLNFENPNRLDFVLFSTYFSSFFASISESINSKLRNRGNLKKWE